MPDRPTVVVVVGAGITGASLAYHLASRGHPVTLLDAGLPGSGATRSSFAWIGRPVTGSLPSAPLRYLALDEYRRLERELPELSIRWSGALVWGVPADPSDRADGNLTTDVGGLEPRLIDPPATVGHRPDDAGFDPIAVTDLLVSAAVRSGARLEVGTPVIGLVREGRTVTGVETTGGDIPAATVVLAAGNGAVPLCSGVGVRLPVSPSPTVLVRLRAPHDLVRRIVAQPDFEVRQQGDGTLLVTAPYRGETTRAALDQVARVAQRRVVASFVDADAVEAVSAEVGWRPMPDDGEPVIGHEPGVPGLYLAVMHSAVTLAAAVGRLAAGEITTGVPAPELAGCRRARFDA